jgi:hypothetical protein
MLLLPAVFAVAFISFRIGVLLTAPADHQHIE